MNCQIRNLSVTGARVRFETEFACPERIKLQLPEGEKKGLVLRAERVWIRERETGLHFTDGDSYEFGQRQWQRLLVNKTTLINSSGETHSGIASDISATGAFIKGVPDNVGDDKVGLAIDQFGKFNASVVRKRDDGVAVTFDQSEDDQNTLQQELDDFRGKNDLEWD